MDFGKLVRTLIQERGAGMVIASKVHHDIVKETATGKSLPRFVTVIRSMRWHMGMFEKSDFRYERLRAVDLVKELGDTPSCREIVRTLTVYDPHSQILFLAVDESHDPHRYCFTPFRATLQGGRVEVPEAIEIATPTPQTT